MIPKVEIKVKSRVCRERGCWTFPCVRAARYRVQRQRIGWPRSQPLHTSHFGYPHSQTHQHWAENNTFHCMSALQNRRSQPSVHRLVIITALSVTQHGALLGYQTDSACMWQGRQASPHFLTGFYASMLSKDCVLARGA